MVEGADICFAGKQKRGFRSGCPDIPFPQAQVRHTQDNGRAPGRRPAGGQVPDKEPDERTEPIGHTTEKLCPENHPDQHCPFQEP